MKNGIKYSITKKNIQIASMIPFENFFKTLEEHLRNALNFCTVTKIESLKIENLEEKIDDIVKIINDLLPKKTNFHINNIDELYKGYKLNTNPRYEKIWNHLQIVIPRFTDLYLLKKEEEKRN